MEIFILEAQQTFPGTLKVNIMNVLHFFVIYRLYLNYNAKLTAERQVINYRQNNVHNAIPTQTFCLKIFSQRKAKNY